MNGGFNGLSTIVMFLLPLIGILAVFAARTMVSFAPKPARHFSTSPHLPATCLSPPATWVDSGIYFLLMAFVGLFCHWPGWWA